MLRAALSPWPSLLRLLHALTSSRALARRRAAQAGRELLGRLFHFFRPLPFFFPQAIIAALLDIGEFLLRVPVRSVEWRVSRRSVVAWLAPHRLGSYQA